MQAVWPGIGIEDVVGGDEKGIFRTATELDTETAVGIDFIAENEVVGPGTDCNAMAAVARDTVEAGG